MQARWTSAYQLGMRYNVWAYLLCLSRVLQAAQTHRFESHIIRLPPPTCARTVVRTCKPITSHGSARRYIVASPAVNDALYALAGAELILLSSAIRKICRDSNAMSVRVCMCAWVGVWV